MTLLSQNLTEDHPEEASVSGAGYLRGDAPRYRDFLQDRVVLLGRYLNG